MNINILVYLNNRFIKLSEAKLHISDLGLRRGFSIFEYFLVTEDRMPFLEDYLDRFYRSAMLLEMQVPIDRALMKEKINYLVKHNGLGLSGVKLLLTGGYSEDLYTPADPNFMILNVPVVNQPGDFNDGVKLILLDYLRHLPEVKTTFYLPSIALLPKLRETGAIEVLFHHNGIVSETTRANIFLVKNNTLVTPSPGVLKGITRKNVLQLAKNIIPSVEREVKLSELWESDEVFITGTSKHVAPVVAIDGRMIGNGKPGEVTKMISEAYERFFNLI